MMKPNHELTPFEVIAMGLVEFEQRFGFRPVDAIEKKWFAVNGKRLEEVSRAAIEAGVIGEFDVSKVVMTDKVDESKER